jgi:hypothetical protein
MLTVKIINLEDRNGFWGSHSREAMGGFHGPANSPKPICVFKEGI